MKALKKVWHEEEGMEALQVVLIIAVAALVLAFLYKTFGGSGSDDGTKTTVSENETVVSWFNARVDSIFKWD